MHRRTVCLIAILMTTPVMAHDGVKDPMVMARMDAMSAVGKAAKTLGEMAKGEAPLHQAKARMARDTLSLGAGKIPALFESPATDPKSEALPLIWENWEDFTARAQAMQAAALELDFTTRNNLSKSMKTLGATCGGCHERYRMDK